MSDLISRQKSLDGLKYEMKYGAEIDRCGLDTAYDIIENIPSAEPEQTAKFQRDGDFLRCSKCWRIVDSGYNYCPHCGVKLDWGE